MCVVSYRGFLQETQNDVSIERWKILNCVIIAGLLSFDEGFKCIYRIEGWVWLTRFFITRKIPSNLPFHKWEA